ncbi:MAG: histidine triad nucleotide-binding protein [Candidatus Kerfeldbacteria bacterium]|nr:histidine triad nucleotide-binding protein [Candidatus Kerfeldbacteria bacterium]
MTGKIDNTISNKANEQCLFCKIAAKRAPSTIVYEDDLVVAFNDIRPIAPVHVLIVPRKHIATLVDLEEQDDRLIGAMVWRAKRLAEQLGVAMTGYRLVFNVRQHAGQIVDHIHLHLIGGKKLGSMA